MKVGEICSRPLLTASPLDRLADVAARMLDEGVGAMGVVTDGQLVGIVTEHDVLRAVVDGPGARVSEVSRYMSRRIVTATADEDASEAALRMVQRHTRHLPVLDGGRFAGMLSARDLLRIEGWPALTHGSGRVHRRT